MRVDRPESRYDVLVVGGGMVGASFAALLAQTPGAESLSILVVEAASPEQSYQPSFDARSTALSWGTRRILQGAGLWSELADCVTPIKQIQVSDRGHFGSALLDRAETGTEALGYVAENWQLGSVLNAALTAAPAIHLLAPARIEAIRPWAEGMELDVESGQESTKVTAGLVVLADGGRSPICAQLGIEQERRDYGQQALIANVSFTQAHDNVAYERFTEDGPLAVLPLGDFESRRRGALVWTVRDAASAALQQLSDTELLPLLQAQFGHRLGTITGIGQRHCYPLGLSVAREQARPGLVLIGNVAHTLHPVAGQGFNLALRDVAVLVQVLARAVSGQRVPGELSVLQEYLEQQAFDQTRSIQFTDRMTRLFSSGDSARVWARKFGILSIDLLPSVRRQFARQAMGLQL